jgi:hypothetical protein
MKKQISIMLLLALLYATACFAQDAAINESDMFNENQFDAQMKQDIAGEQKNKLEYLPGGTFIFNTNLVTIDDYTSYYAFGRLYGTAFVKVTQPDIGVLYLSSLVSSYLFQGTNSTDPAITGQGHDLLSVDFSIAEFYFSFDIVKTLFVRAGKQLVAWGPSLVWTPGDFINLQKNSSLERIDLRGGKPLLKLHLPVGGSTISTRALRGKNFSTMCSISRFRASRTFRMFRSLRAYRSLSIFLKRSISPSISHTQQAGARKSLHSFTATTASRSRCRARLRSELYLARNG